MKIIRIPFENEALPHGVVLGYDGENLTTELQIVMPEINDKAAYWIELSNGEQIKLKAKDDCLCGDIKAEILTVGDVNAQLCWSWNGYKDGEEVTFEDKSNIAHWRVLDSVELSRDYEKAYPDVLGQIMADYKYIIEHGGAGGGGIAGDDGFSPIVELAETETGVEINITDAEGEKTALVKHRKDGTDGKDGVDGKDGYTPKKGVDYFDGTNGRDGYTPQKGIDYFDGKDGKDGQDGIDGFTPTITLSETDGGVKITTTNKDAEDSSIVVLHGKDGAKGENGKDGENYVITEDDYTAIAEVVLTMIPDGDAMIY